MKDARGRRSAPDRYRCRVHSDFDLGAGLRDRESASKRSDQFRSRLERVHYFFAPSACLPALSRWTA
jgi:hypothetical protein